ncbi:Cyclin-B1-5 [Hordeum vulgare]|nr:Cyclin-B1-5 [Hordeum vulgare]
MSLCGPVEECSRRVLVLQPAQGCCDQKAFWAQFQVPSHLPLLGTQMKQLMEVNDFISIADPRQQTLSMEKILNSMAWALTVLTPYVFPVRFAKAAGSDKEVRRTCMSSDTLGAIEFGSYV